VARLQGSLSGAVNYYQRISQWYQLTSIGFSKTATFQFQFQATRYDCTEQIGYRLEFFRTQADPNPCFKADYITPSSNPMGVVTQVYQAPPNGIEWTGTSGATGCTDFEWARVTQYCYHYPGICNLDTTFVLDYSVSDVAPQYCIYGTQKIPGQSGAILITQEFLQAVADKINLKWAIDLFKPFVGSYVPTDDICGSAPPVWDEIKTHWMTFPPTIPVEVLYAFIWPVICQCIPGEQSTTQYPPPNWTKPPDFPDPPIYQPNPSNPCLDITEIRYKLDVLLNQGSGDGGLTKLLQRYLLPFAYVSGARHTALRGTGSVAISRLVGFRVEIIQRAYATHEVGGNPVYLWDQGWISVSDPNGMIEERRLTRDSEVWLPRLAPTALYFNYFLKDGCIATFTELEAET
jgi:hypothetical protein